MRVLLWASFLFLMACGRPLTPNEVQFARSLYGEELNPKPVRLVNGHFARSLTLEYAARPRVTCQERILPPLKEATYTTSPGAIAVYTRVFFRKDLHRPDFAREYSVGTDLYDLMLFAHEMAHVWQWQNRQRTGYTPLKAASEHTTTADPYLFDINSAPDFLSYPYEQQAAIVEEFVCCRALAPQAARTARLHKMLSVAMPVDRLQSGADSLAVVPWKGAEIQGICD
ncbi:MAG: hypothetical protein JXR13_11975 [Thalassovita sp.]